MVNISRAQQVKHLIFDRWLGSLLPAALMLFCSFSSIADSFLTDPKFSILSTEQGLSQDSISALMLDQDGFLWVGTQGGLNRYDGYRVEHITGDDNELKDVAITALFQASDGKIWTSTETGGVFTLNLNDQTVTPVGNWKLSSYSDYKQFATDFIEPTPGSVLIALVEEVVKYTGAGEYETLFAMPEALIKEEHVIRKIWADNEVLVAATTKGIFGVDLNSKTVKPVEYISPEAQTADNMNSKFLLATEEDDFWIGTVEGLYHTSWSALKNSILTDAPLPKVKEAIEELNIWKMQRFGPFDYYVATNEGLFQYDSKHEARRKLFQLTDSRDYLTDNNVVDMIVDDQDNLWVGTRYDGALYWVSRSTKFVNVLSTPHQHDNSDEAHTHLSNNMVQALLQTEKDFLWVGTRNGVNKFHTETGEVKTFNVNPDPKAFASAASIYQILPAGDDNLWLVTLEGLQLFNPVAGRSEAPLTTNPQADELLNSAVWAAHTDEKYRLWFLNDTGVHRYDPSDGEVVSMESINAVLQPDSIYRFIDDYSEQENAFLVAANSALYRYNSETDDLTLIHELKDSGKLHSIQPDSVAMDDNGVLWIAYPTYGLVGIDPQTGEERYVLTESQTLPTNLIYGLLKDEQGNMWMSSHQGLLKFYPENQHAQTFGYTDGVVSYEFNQAASTRLQDGRLVYGSQKGFTLFDPLTIETQSKGEFKVAISHMELASSPLNLPLTDLDGQHIELNYDDVGLQIRFSSLTYSQQNKTRYVYGLSGAKNAQYPATNDPEVLFPLLKPGNYTFYVHALDPTSGRKSNEASLTISVNHAPWSSPQAYAFYALSAAGLLFFWWVRRNAQERQIRQSHNEALKSKNRLSLALTASNSNVWEWDARKRVFYAPRIVDELGYKELGNEVSFEHHLSLIHEADREIYETQWKHFVENQEPGLDVTYRMQARNGRWQWYRDVGSVVSETHEVEQLVVAGTYTNITESLATREKVRLFGEAFRHTRDWVLIFNHEFVPVAVNTALCDAFDINEDGDLESQIKIVFKLDSDTPPYFWKKLHELDGEDHWKGEEDLEAQIGRGGSVAINMTSISDEQHRDSADYYLVIMSDITEQKKAETELRRLANFDSLTGLPNRTLLLDRIQHAIEHAQRQKSMIAVLFIDLDRFKQVNDSLGHEAGDELLRVVASRLTHLLRQDDTVARLGGDEFVVMLENVNHPDKLSTVAAEIINVLEASITLGNQTVSVSSSIGIAVYPSDATHAEALLKDADIAMYYAKEEGRNNYQFFTEHMNERAQARLALENKIKRAHQRQEFINYYQPIVNADSGLIEGFELLMRWPSEDGMISPDVFIPVAEELGLIEGMTQAAIERALPHLKEWQECGREIYLSVNLSARHFERQMSIEQVVDLLQSNSLTVSSLRFEITESALMRDYARAQEYMSRMQAHGFVIALDDFGTGYSSLKYLKEFPIQVLKIDRSFVADIGADKSDEAIIVATLRMAQSLNMTSVAEGIEQPQQIAFLKQHGCQKLQGYFFSRPLPDNEIQPLLDQHWNL